MSAQRIRAHEGRLDPTQEQAALAALREGALVALPTETVYGLAARADHPAAVAKLRALKGLGERAPLALHFAHDDLDALPVRWNAPARRLAARYWPGPILLVLPSSSAEEHLGLRSPATPLTRAVLRAAGFPVVIAAASRGSAPALEDAAAVERELGGELALVVDAGLPPLGEPSTVVKLGRGPLQVLREGILRADEVRAVTGRRYVFVCTGNTCRSPMAEAWMRRRIAQHLECADREVASYGYAVHSMGVAASPGEPASGPSIAVLREAGIDLRPHRASRLERERLRSAHHVLAMGPQHLEVLLDVLPELAGKARLVADRPVPDPIGGSLEDYRRCSEVLRHAVENLPL
ncbi:MAG: Sua5/YciO/YrdC/YwlC family protein [Planctomycetes bacterium]|nr:Sua5/YciO/YrdC/YwlC family protein [Planctomycetota bacterium]